MSTIVKIFSEVGKALYDTSLPYKIHRGNKLFALAYGYIEKY